MVVHPSSAYCVQDVYEISSPLEAGRLTPPCKHANLAYAILTARMEGNPFANPPVEEPASKCVASDEQTSPSSDSASVPAAAADFCCPFVDLETQNALADRLLSCLANQTVLQKRSAEDGAHRLRLLLLPGEKDRRKKGGLTLLVLDERVRTAEAKATKTSLGHEGFATKLFTSRDELQKRHDAALTRLTG